METEDPARGPLDAYFRLNQSNLRILVGDPKDEEMEEEALASPPEEPQDPRSAPGADMILVEKDSKSKSLTTNDVDPREGEATGSKRSGRPKRERPREEKLHGEDRGSWAAAKKHSNEDTSSRVRREFKNYDEMIASVGLLRYMDWEKVDPKVHQNSPYHNPPMTGASFWFMACATYFARGVRARYPEILRAVRQQPSVHISTLIAPVYNYLSKKYSDGQLRTAKSRSDQPAASKKGRKPTALDTSQFKNELIASVYDKKHDKKHRLQYSIRDDIFINTIRAFLLRKYQDPQTEGATKERRLEEVTQTSLAQMISDLEADLHGEQSATDELVKQLTKKMELELNAELYFEGNYRRDSLLKDMQLRFEDEDLFLDRMEFKQQTSVLTSIKNSQECRDKFVFPEKERPKKSEDYVCQICSDGDYTDSNQIVFCARCNISFHQRCYGIAQIPEGNWICDLCKHFGPAGRFVRCALCTRRGGCLRRVDIPAISDFWKQRNSSYFEAAARHKIVSKEEPPELYNKGEALIDDNVSVNSKNFEDFLYYDYYKELDKFKPSDSDLEPKSHLTWVHLSCCLWIPKLEVTCEPVPNMVQSFDQVDKRRFQMECSICGKKEGACIQCSAKNCQEPFHVECARRTKMYMETKNADNRFYTIYCDRHAPLMAKRKLDSQANSICNDINKFCRYIEKFYDSYRYKFEERPPEEETPAYVRLLHKKRLEKAQSNPLQDKLMKNKFIKQVKNELSKFPDFGNVITIKKDDLGQPASADYEPPKKVFLKSAIHKNHKVWNQLAKKHAWPFANIYKKYKRVLMGSNESPLEGLIKSKPVKRTKDFDEETEPGVVFVQNTEDFDDKPYCICQKPWRGEIMVECGKCLQWFHPLCLGIEETDDLKLNQMDVMCTNCLDDDEEEDEEAYLGKRTSRQESADFDHDESMRLDKLSADDPKPEMEEEESSEKLRLREPDEAESDGNEPADPTAARRTAPLKERNKNQELHATESDESREGKPRSQAPVGQAGAKSSLLPQL